MIKVPSIKLFMNKCNEKKDRSRVLSRNARSSQTLFNRNKSDMDLKS